MEETVVPQSLVEQVLQATFSALADKEEFDDQTLQQLQNLNISGNLIKPAKVARILKLVPGRTQ